MSAFDKIAAALDKALGGSDEPATVSQWIDTGFLPLNMSVSGRVDGGLPAGRIVEILGPPSSGKTAIATAAMIYAQKAGGVAGFNDHENSFEFGLAESLGLNTKPGHFLYKKPASFEASVSTFINAVRTIRSLGAIPDEAPLVWVFDSIAAMVPQQMLDKDATALNMNDTTALARLTSKCFPAVAQVCDRHNVLAIFLNQVRTKPGVMYGDPTTSPGGEAPRFYASVRIQLGASKLAQGKGEDQVVIGQEVRAKIIKNKVGRPFLVSKWRFLFNEDGKGYFDRIGSTLSFAIERGLLEQSGAYVTWVDGKKYYPSALAKKIEAEGLFDQLAELFRSREVDFEVDASTEETREVEADAA